MRPSASAAVAREVPERRQGVFAVNESKDGHAPHPAAEGLAGKVKFITFDPSPTLIQGMQDKTVHGIVLQDPVNMGYVAVKTMLQHLKGDKVEKRIPTGEYIATPENMNSDQMKKLLHPDQFGGK
ncbi:MAG: substrate-binding domain-containing protein [Planctomycetales bacterium]